MIGALRNYPAGVAIGSSHCIADEKHNVLLTFKFEVLNADSRVCFIGICAVCNDRFKQPEPFPTKTHAAKCPSLVQACRIVVVVCGDFRCTQSLKSIMFVSVVDD